MAAKALDVEHVAVHLLSTDGLSFRVAAGVGLLAGQRIDACMANRPDMLAGWVAAKGQPCFAIASRREPVFADAQVYGDAGLTSSLAVPLFDCGRAIGVLAVWARGDRHFGIEEVRFLETLSSLLAASLQRVRTDEALSHSQGLKSVGQLTGGIAHDFNNLLTVISGNLQVLEDFPAITGDPEMRQMVGAASRAAKRGATLTGKLLAFSRRQVLRPVRVDVGALLCQLAEVLGRTLDQRIRITLEVEPGCPPCTVDPGQLESALLNIAINARDAMPEGGTLSFRARVVGDVPPEAGAERLAVGHPGNVAIAIGDTGAGMTDAVKQRAFEPFFTTKEIGRGTGLGLSTVFGFMDQSHGAVMLDSTLGVGTTITLFLPQHAEAEVESGDVATQTSVPRGLRVLLVEDDAEVRAVTQSFLAAADCEATACASGEQAIALLALLAARDGRALFDLLLTDVGLGAGMRGTELAREVRRLSPSMPVLLVSGFSDELLEAPVAWPLLHKPYTRAELAEAIAQALH
ncbi:ATP-binding protein [Piscinibacter sp.]|uniref:ATP-binding protein n=1 Tax=Piscinibacter sp. TaxID=1903157 RepID=UPI002CFB0E06|nr:ATP-binding protein [Albitalea sp.]HUG21053.1 ATP-binding protein [Albitalea sp.]